MCMCGLPSPGATGLPRKIDNDTYLHRHDTRAHTQSCVPDLELPLLGCKLVAVYDCLGT